MLLKHSDENIVLQAVMDEFEENREKGNLTAELLNREKVCNWLKISNLCNIELWTVDRHTYDI